jgi:hypothetical protein
MALDLTKPVQTRRGGKVTIWDASFKRTASDIPTVYGKEEFEGIAYCRTWRATGEWDTYSGRNYLDLVNVPGTLDTWVNIYQDGAASYWSNRDYADACAVKGRIACVHIVQEYTVGEGL